MGAWEFLDSANTIRLLIIGVFAILALCIILLWVENSHRSIKLWPPEVSAPESDRVKACRTMQLALHDELSSLENYRASYFTSYENSQAAMNEQQKLLVDAIERDRQQTKTKGINSDISQHKVESRINNLQNNASYANQEVTNVTNNISSDYTQVQNACALILDEKN